MSNLPAYGPDRVCQRTLCTADGPADHLGGAHLNPRDRERFDGNGISMRVVTYRVRSQLSALNEVSRQHPELAEVVDVAVHAALEEIGFLNDQLAHVRVDADRKVREASKRALDCDDHGKVIRDLEGQLHHFDQAAERSEKGRLALLGGITAFDQFVDAVDVKKRLGEPLPDTSAVVEAIRGVVKKVHAAHTRAWSK